MAVLQVAVGVASRPHPEDPGRIQVLVARRAPDAHQGGLLELPGGKVEPGESVAEALVREFREEVALEIDPARLEPLITIEHDYGDRAVRLEVRRILSWTGEARGLEGQPLEWRVLEELHDEDFPPANRPILRALKLPRALLITAETLSPVYPDDCALREAYRSWSGAFCILRAPALSAADYEALYQRVRPLASEAGIGLLLHGAPDWLERLPDAAGIHLPWRAASALKERPVASGYWLGVSCHNGEELAQAEQIGADYAVLSPVRPTSSHPEREALGWEAFSRLSTAAALPVYAMGGLGSQHDGRARAAGAQGVAGISYWWKQVENAG